MQIDMILKHLKQNISSIGARHQCTRAPSVRDSPTPWEAKSAEGQAISYNKLYTKWMASCWEILGVLFTIQKV